MIEFQNVTKYFEHKGQKKFILQDASCVIPAGKNMVILGKDGSGKSVVTNLMSNASFPNSGRVIYDETISWPVGFKSSLLPGLSARENVEFVCMLMRAGKHKRKHVQDFIYDFTELGKYYDIELKTYSKSMRARLSFALCFAFEFDTYLLDDFTFSGDTVLAEKAEKFITEHRSKSRLIMSTKNLQRIKGNCDCALLISNNKLTFIDNIDTAVEEYKKMFKNSSDAFMDESDDDHNE
jgi:capsular polysaccharide transport system ATP-binding protein